MKKYIGGNGNSGSSGNSGNDVDFGGYTELRVSRGTERFIELPGGKQKRRPKDRFRKVDISVRLERSRRAQADTPEIRRSCDKRRDFRLEA